MSLTNGLHAPHLPWTPAPVILAQVERDAALHRLYEVEQWFKGRSKSTGWDRAVVGSYRAAYAVSERTLLEAKKGKR